MKENFSDKLSKDYTIDLDIQLRAGGYFRFIRRLLIWPLSIIRQPLASFLGLLILPASLKLFHKININEIYTLVNDNYVAPAIYDNYDRKIQNSRSFKKEDINSVKISRVTTNQIIGKDVSYGLFKLNESIANEVSERKITIFIGGNTYYTNDFRETMCSESLKSLKTDLYGIDHPERNHFWDLDKEKTIRNACSHIKRLLDAGYSPENMTFEGMSIGGAITAAALDRFKGYQLADGRVMGENAFFGAFIAEKTFSNLGDWLVGRSVDSKAENNPHIFPRILSWILQQILNFAKWDFNTSTIWDNLPVAQKYAFNTEDDNVIPTWSALARTSTKGHLISDTNIHAKVQVGEKDYQVDLEEGHSNSLHKPTFLAFINAVVTLNPEQKTI